MAVAAGAYAALKGIPLMYKIMAAFMAGQMGLSAYTGGKQRGLQRTQMGLEQKALLGQQATVTAVAKSKRRGSQENIREMQAIMRERGQMRLAEREIESRKEQNIADQMMITQLMQAMMTQPTRQEPVMPATTIMGLLRG